MLKASTITLTFLRLLIVLLAGLTAAFTVLGFAGQIWWVFSFLDHPRPQYAAILLIALFLGVINRKPIKAKRWQCLWLLPLLLNLWLILPTGQVTRPGFSGMALKVVHITVDHEQTNPQPTIDYLEALKADVVSIVEITPATLPLFETGLKHYQLVTAEPLTNSHGSAWFMATKPRIPLKPLQHRIIHLPHTSTQPILSTTLKVGDREMTFLCFHAIRPSDAAKLAYQVEEFTALSQWSQAQLPQKQDLVVIGDFNDTPWSVRFRSLLAKSGLHLAHSGWGVYPTWHTHLPTFLRIPIDHCLLSPTLSARSYRVGHQVNSDHAPIEVELAL